jgi:putative phosphoribosyl transferase
MCDLKLSLSTSSIIDNMLRIATLVGMYHRYRSRQAAGQVLADLLAKHPFVAAPLIVALPRGGVPIGFEVAQRLHLPLDILVVRKIGAPGHSELACGAFIVGGEVVWNTQVMKALKVTREDLEDTYQEAVVEGKNRETALRTPESPPIPLKGRSVIIVDDGLATGATMKAAFRGVQREHPREIVIAIPVGPQATCRELEQMGCSLMCDQRIDDARFSSVGEWYDEFPQVSTEECIELLVRSRRDWEGDARKKREHGSSPFM